MSAAARTATSARSTTSCKAIDWKRHFAATRTLRVDVAATRSPLTSLEFATLRVKDAVCDRFRADVDVRPSIDKRAPDVRVHAYLTDRDATLYLDTSGEPLFKRGYRRDADEAPLRENLAAGLLALTGWTPACAFLDPMCGSGTIATEAALIAAERAPGLARTFGFQKLAWFDGPAVAAHEADRARPLQRRAASPTIFASDIARAPSARRNRTCAPRRSTASCASSRPTSSTAPRPRRAASSSPTRLTACAWPTRRSSRALSALGDALKQRFAGWTAFFFTGDLRLPKLIHLKVARKRRS